MYYTDEIIEILHDIENKFVHRLIDGGVPWALGFEDWKEWDSQKRFRFPIAYYTEQLFNLINKGASFLRMIEYKITGLFKPRNCIRYRNVGVDHYTPDVMLSVNFRLLEEYIASINLTEITIWGEDSYEEKLLKLFDWWLVRKYSETTNEDDTKHLIELMKIRVDLW